MIKLKMPVIVEGKYDKITLENVIDTLIIPTNGFSIFKDKEKCELIRTFAQTNGIIVLTDSDSAGNMIRAHIKNICGGGKVYNVYVPQLKGKEKRKNAPSKEGFLGVEGISRDILCEAFLKSGVTVENITQKSKPITKTDMFLFGLSGNHDAASNRKILLKHLNLPENLSPNAMLSVVNTMFSYEEFEKAVLECQKLMGKS
ncbi:MAG: DUF4093 domain-containing protein [Clostridia bacterium]|nr:DUF4093 domain-containing protein [Clostridia bacterium]